MKRPVIISHYDADGVTSQAIARKIWGKNSVSLFQKWHKFGVDSQDYKTLASYDPSVVIVLDLGAEDKTLDSLNNFAEGGIPVWLIDNHPPADKTKMIKYGSDKFKICSTGDNCTAGSLYSTFADAITDETALKWAKIWAAIGIYGDMATGSPQGKNLYDAIQAEHKILGTKILKWTKGEDGKFGTAERDLIGVMAQYFQAPRRIARHYGAYTALQMCDEIERADDITLPEQDFNNDVRLQALYPATYMVKKWKEEWSANWTKVFQSDNIRFWDLGSFTFSQVNHPWNVSTQVANIKANDSSRSKPHFCLNSFPVDELVTIGARRPNKEECTLDLGKVLVRVTELSGGKVYGGGLSMAASAHAPANTSVSEIVNLLLEAVGEMEIAQAIEEETA